MGDKQVSTMGMDEKCAFMLVPSMQLLINGIITPYFDQKREELGLPSCQCSPWMIDCWSVHKLE